MSTNQKYILTALLAFCVGFGSAWLLVSNRTNSGKTLSDYSTTTPEMNDSTDTDNSVISEKSETNSVVVKDQTAGTAVTFDSVTLEKGGWVVIYEGNEDNKPGKILGAQLLDLGSNQTGKVELLRGTVAGGKYFAILQSDNGDRTFDSKKDLPITDQAGEMIMSTFNAL